MIEAVVYDMDGLLIDSEPFWREAEKEVFGALGVPLTDAMCEEVMGFRIDEVVHYWHERYPWQGRSFKEVENDVVERLIALVIERGTPMPGVQHSINFFRSKGIRLALASSSPMRIINAVLQKFEIASYFEVVYSAEFEAYGKPHPGTFITAAQQLGVLPSHCLVFEDSLNGVIAGKAAKMITIAIPESTSSQLHKFAVADAQLNSLLDVDETFWSQWNKA